MAPARNLRRRHCDSYECHFPGGANFKSNQEKASLVLSSSMAEAEEEGDDVGSSSTSKEGDDPFKGWLQLGIGGTGPTGSSRASMEELNLFSERQPLPMMRSANPNFHPLVKWGELRVVSPPARSRTGVWFELKAAENQGKLPFLPQISKSYLRIKDGRMTVRLLMKYLATKLELNDESQVEITCRGQQLHPVLTLRYVRDNIWCTTPTVTMMPLNLQITDHVMILHYGRRA